MISNKEKMLEAINNYDLLTPTQKKVLSVLVKIEVDEEVISNIKSLSTLSKVTRASVYTALENFQLLDLVTTEPGTKKKVIFKLNVKNLEGILDRYIKVKNI